MIKKIDQLRAEMLKGNWQKAIAIAARFPRLNNREIIERAHMAYTNPRFLVQLGRNVEDCIKAGIEALTNEYTEKHG